MSSILPTLGKRCKYRYWFHTDAPSWGTRGTVISEPSIIATDTKQEKSSSRWG